MEGKLIDFYRYLRTINKQSTSFVAANLGLEYRGISDCWLSELNKKDRGENIFKCDVSNIYNNIKTMIECIMSVIKGILTFSVAMDGSKVPNSININTAHKCIMGGVYPYHLIYTTHLSKEEIMKILYNKPDKGNREMELASEVKVATICFQNPPKGMSPMAIISARPQGVNAPSTFTDDVCRAASKIANEYKNVEFTNFATDGVSVETHDIMNTLFKFLDGKISFLGAVDNKHNVKNHRYQYIGGSNVASIGNSIVDVNLLLQANVSKDLISPKDFSSDKKVEQLFSFGTLLKVHNSYSEGSSTSKFMDYSSLLATFFFSKLHLYAINALHVPAKHRAFYLCITVIYFTTIDGINPIPKRNMVLESIANTFLCLRSDITKIRYCTSELCEHMFSNIRQEKREFTCSEFSDFVDKQNRRIRLNFKSNIKVSNDNSLSGYQETLAEFLQSAMIKEDCSGPCQVDLQSLDPVSKQL